MKWENLLKTKCPNCGKKLHFRTAFRKLKWHQRIGSTDDDLYLCRSSKCKFQISGDRLRSMLPNLEKKYGKEEFNWDCLGRKL